MDQPNRANERGVFEELREYKEQSKNSDVASSNMN